jgi:hypothetical protein
MAGDIFDQAAAATQQQSAPPPADIFDKAEESNTLWGHVKSFFSESSTKNQQLNHDAQHMTPAQFAAAHPEFTQPPSGAQEAYQDVKEGNYAKAIHRTIAGLGEGMAPALVPAMAAAPIATIAGLALGKGGQLVGQQVGKMAGLTPDQQNVAGDVGAIAGGYAGSKLTPASFGDAPEKMYESAMKPSTTIPEATRAKMVQTGLENEIPVTKGGLDKLGDLVDDLNDKTARIIDQANQQGATVNKYAVASRLGNAYQRFATQVNPVSDLEAVSKSGNEFIENQPNEIPAAQAQAMKQGTYTQLRGKYGELGSATIESQKALARGIKEELINQFPELEGLGKQEGALLQLQPVLERAVNRISNHQIVGIGTPIVAGGAKVVTGSTGVGVIAGLLKAVVDDPMVKSRLAISLSKGGGISQAAAFAKLGAYSGALVSNAHKSADQEGGQ